MSSTVKLTVSEVKVDLKIEVLVELVNTALKIRQKRGKKKSK